MHFRGGVVRKRRGSMKTSYEKSRGANYVFRNTVHDSFLNFSANCLANLVCKFYSEIQ